MKEFVMIYRNETMPENKYSPEEMQGILKQWENWMGGIAAQNKLASRGNRLGSEGKSIKPNNVITNGPYSEIKEFIGGYSVIKADSIDEAVEIAKGCPILNVGGNVEVRDIMLMNA
jgi:hypothetical protein